MNHKSEITYIAGEWGVGSGEWGKSLSVSYFYVQVKSRKSQ
ncbi:hypothetical protein PN483_07815 [Nodularia spumigena CS-591/04]|nr:hypothetical protein [Nodularia spumigena CS-591/04]